MVDDRLPPRKVLYTQMTVKEYVHKKMYKKHCVPKTYKSMHKQKGISKLWHNRSWSKSVLEKPILEKIFLGKKHFCFFLDAIASTD